MTNESCKAPPDDVMVSAGGKRYRLAIEVSDAGEAMLAIGEAIGMKHSVAAFQAILDAGFSLARRID